MSGKLWPQPFPDIIGHHNHRESFIKRDNDLRCWRTLKHNLIIIIIIIIIIINNVIYPTAVEQALACALSRSGPGFESRSGQVSWVRFFRGFSSPVRQMSGNFRPRISFSHHNHHFIFVLLEWLIVCLVCIFFHVCAVSEVAPALSWSLILGGPPCPSVDKKYVCDPEINSLPP